jgi:outer membrane protein assembly factor BamD
MKNRWMFGWVILGALLLQGCGSSEQVLTMTPEQRFEAAKAKFDDHDYIDAASDFTVITLQYQGSKVAADAQYYLAECRFQHEDYILAAFEYSVVKRNYPASPRVADAQFKLALCYYYRAPRQQLDQEYTRKAIDEFQTFVEYYPKHPSVPEAEQKIRELTSRLASKQFACAELYSTMDYTKAALFYYDTVIEKYHDTEFAPRAYLRKAEILRDKGRVPEAIAELSRLIDRYPHADELTEASILRDKLEGKGH